MKLVLFALYLASSVFMPWWFVVPFGIVVATFPYGAPVAVAGGLLLDTLYGAPVAAFGGYHLFYTALFVCCALSIEFLSDRVVD